MSRVNAFDAFFLLTETRSSPWHMAGCEIFELPAKAGKDYLNQLADGLRAQSAAAPFNLKLETGLVWPSWREVEPDIDYHFSRQQLPEPGSTQQLMSALEHFGAATLDRNVPLWECCLIEGLENKCFAIAFKVHHSLVDGQGGLKMILRALSDRKSDSNCRALWGKNTPARSASSKPRSREEKPNSALSALDNCLKAAANLNNPLSIDTIQRCVQQFNDLRWFRAKPSVMNQRPCSSARRFGIGDLPLQTMLNVSKSNDATINDVLLCVVDAAVQRYLEENDNIPTAALLAAMPVSTRKQGAEGGNQAGLLCIELGEPRSDITQRLRSIIENTQRAKTHLRELPDSFLMAYGVAVLGMPLLMQAVPGLAENLPMANLGISNVSPPKGSHYLDKPLYLNGSKLVGLYTQPILPPSVLLNVTAASMKGKLCLGIGSTREAIDEPLRLAAYIEQALDELDAAA